MRRRDEQLTAHETSDPGVEIGQLSVLAAAFPTAAKGLRRDFEPALSAEA
jgi:hypothetical protein